MARSSARTVEGMGAGTTSRRTSRGKGGRGTVCDDDDGTVGLTPTGLGVKPESGRAGFAFLVSVPGMLPRKDEAVRGCVAERLEGRTLADGVVLARLTWSGMRGKRANACENGLRHVDTPENEQSNAPLRGGRKRPPYHGS